MDDMEDLDDEEVSLGSMDEEDFGDELEEEGGTFMDPDEGGEEEEDDESRESQKAVPSFCSCFVPTVSTFLWVPQIFGCECYKQETVFTRLL